MPVPKWFHSVLLYMVCHPPPPRRFLQPRMHLRVCRDNHDNMTSFER